MSAKKALWMNSSVFVCAVIVSVLLEQTFFFYLNQKNLIKPEIKVTESYTELSFLPHLHML